MLPYNRLHKLKIKSKPLTRKQIEETMTDYFKGKNLDMKLTIEELKAKILMGYQYQITSEGDRKISMCTGKGGVLMYIDAFDGRMPAGLIQDSISVWVDGAFHKLADATVTKQPKSES